MHIDEQGEGPAVLLLHGSAMAPSSFEPLIAALRPTRRVLVPHFPGYGKTPPVQGPYRVEAVAAELEAALLARGVSDVAVVGASFGAWRALGLALRGAVQVSRLALLGGFAALSAPNAEGLRGLAGTVRTMADLRNAAFRRQIAMMFLAPTNATPAALAEVEGWLDATTPTGLADDLEAASHTADVHPHLRRLRIPLLARVGELDAATPVAYSESIVAMVPGAELQRVPSCGHALLVEDEAATVAAMCRALAV